MTATTDAQAADRPNYPPLSEEVRDAVSTEAAAYYLDLKPQTMRVWSFRETGPIRPVRVNKRLRWRTNDLRRLLGVNVK